MISNDFRERKNRAKNSTVTTATGKMTKKKREALKEKGKRFFESAYYGLSQQPSQK